MTEDEATQKWCPFVRTEGSGGNTSINGKMAMQARCNGSACMAWRWKFEQINKQPHNQVTWPAVEPVYKQTEQGYCGLAGHSQ